MGVLYGVGLMSGADIPGWYCSLKLIAVYKKAPAATSKDTDTVSACSYCIILYTVHAAIDFAGSDEISSKEELSTRGTVTS